MTKRILFALLALCACLPAAKAQTSQFQNSTLTGTIFFKIANTNNSLSQSTLTLQSNTFGLWPITSGVGTNSANQLYLGSISLTNGALVGTNWLNLNSPAATDAVGNAYALTQVKFLAFQNMGCQSGYGAFETNVAWIMTPPVPSAATNIMQGTNILKGPSTNAASGNTLNTPIISFFDPGDVSWPVYNTNNFLVLTNPVAGSQPVQVNVYLVGATGP
jgi:hypothetical protein